jgi:hypothetical protein
LFSFAELIERARKSNLEPKQLLYYNLQREKLAKHARQF